MSVEVNGEPPIEVIELVNIESVEFEEIRGNPHSAKANKLIKKFGRKLTNPNKFNNI